MVLTSFVLVSGSVWLGARGNRNRKPKRALVATLSNKGAAHTVPKKQKSTPLATPRVVAIGTLAVGGSTLLLAGANGYTPIVLAQRLVTLLRASRYGPLLYIAMDTLRPLTFFPDIFMTVASGLIFGPVLGLTIALVGNMTSALVAYHVGQSLRVTSHASLMTDRSVIADGNDEKQEEFADPIFIRRLLVRYGAKMQKQPFTSMLLLHGMMLYFDAINCLAGYLGLQLRPFLSGVLLGALPATVASVLAGASFHGSLRAGTFRFNPLTFAASGLLVVSSLSVAHYLRKWDDGQAQVALPDLATAYFIGRMGDSVAPSASLVKPGAAPTL